MDIVSALLAFLLSLLGVDTPSSTFQHVENRDGRAVLHARARLEAGVARFECLSSPTGLCYWTVRPARCVDAQAPCAQRFATAVDDSRQLTGLARLRLCVADRAGAARACHAMGDG